MKLRKKIVNEATHSGRKQERSLLIKLFLRLQVWSAYKDQKHDLFLPSNAQTSAAGVAGLIESSSRLTYALTAAPSPQPALVRLPSSSPAAPSGPVNHASGRHS